MRRRHQALGLAVGVGAIGVVWFVATSLPDLSDELTTPTPVDVAEVAAVAEVPSQLEWTVEPGTVGSFHATAALWSSDGFIYALSTAPGLRELPIGEPPGYAVYRSQDGFTWDSQPLQGLGEDLWARDLDNDQGRLYVAGTAPSLVDPAAAGLRVGVSEDGGGNWSQVDLEITAPPPAGALGPSHVTVDLAGGHRALLAAATTRYSLDYSHMVPNGLLGPSAYVQRTIDGLAVYDYGEAEAIARSCELGNQASCLRMDQLTWEPVLRWSASWEELGIEPDPEVFVDLYLTKDGANFERVETPFNVDYSLERLAAGADGFFAVLRAGSSNQGQSLIEVWHSSGGEEWERMDDAPPLDEVTTIGATGDLTVIVGLRDRQIAVASWSGARWEQYDLTGIAPVAGPDGQWISAASVGPAGVVINVQSWVRTGPEEMREVTQLLETADLEEWSSTPSGSLVSGYVDQVLVGDGFLFVNALTGGVDGRIHAVATRGGG